MGRGDFCLNWCDLPLGLGASCERRGGAKGGAPAPSSFPSSSYVSAVRSSRPDGARRVGNCRARQAAGRGYGAANAGVGPGERHRDATAQAQACDDRCHIGSPHHRRPAVADLEGRRGDRSAHRRARLSRRLQGARPARGRRARALHRRVVLRGGVLPCSWYAPTIASTHSGRVPRPRFRRSTARSTGSTTSCSRSPRWWCVGTTTPLRRSSAILL